MLFTNITANSHVDMNVELINFSKGRRKKAPVCSFSKPLVPMIFTRLCLGLIFTPLTSAADTSEKKDTVAPVADIPTMVAQLGHESFTVREKAMAGLWQLGDASLPALRLAAEGADPEVTTRARELILYITAGVLPDSPEEVKQLVIKFSRSAINNKLAILRKLMDLGQWKQVLHLARFEDNPADRARMANVVQEAASKAARAAIVAGDVTLAGEILELTGEDEQNMAMRAWFYVRQGQLKQQLAKAAEMPGKKGAVWRMSLHRANGDAQASMNEAQKAGFGKLSAAMRVFTGDAQEWLEKGGNTNRISPILSMGYQIQKARLSGQPRKAGIIARELTRMANDQDTATQAAICLAANGFSKEALSLMVTHNLEAAFDYYDNIEAPQQCLRLLGIEKDAKPPYTKWVRKTTDSALDDEDDDSHHDRLLMLASFLYRHGLGEHSMAVMTPLMKALEEDGSDAWFDLLKSMRAYDLGWMAVEFTKSRGNNDGEMDLAVKKIIDGSKAVTEIWSAVKKRNPDDVNMALHEICLLAGIIADTKQETDKIHQALLAEIVGPDAKDDVSKDARSEALFNFAFKRNNAAEASRLADLFAAQNNRWDRSKVFLDAALHRWAKVEPVYAAAAKKRPGDYLNLMKWCITLRHLGRDKEAAELYDRSLMLTMGDAEALGKIASELSESGYDAEAAALWEHSAIMAPVGTTAYDRAILFLATYGEDLYQSKQWKKASAISEAYARIMMRGRSGAYLHRVLRVRFYADFCHAMHLLESGQRDLAIAKLDACRLLIPGDGALADHFFPILRKVGVGEHYKRWFEASYQHVDAACKLYPKSHNSRNTAAWLASRAVLRLDDALRHAEAALKIRPTQGAYLDTMAEVWFSRGNRQKAVEWSEKAVAASIGDAQGSPRTESQVLTNYSQLTKQLRRFKKAPMPK